MQLDSIDHVAAKALDGYLVRKDLVRTFSRQFPVPTYVVEFMLGRFCASIDEEEINEGSLIQPLRFDSDATQQERFPLFGRKMLPRLSQSVQHVPLRELNFTEAVDPKRSTT